MTMAQWYSASELAGLPGLPGTERRIRAKAQRENWPSRPAQGKKGREYPETCIPEEAQAALRNRRIAAAMDKITAAHEAELAPAFAAREAKETARRERKSEADLQRIKRENMQKFAALAQDDPKRQRAVAREWCVNAVGQERHEYKGPAAQLTQRAAIDSIVAKINSGERALPAHVAPWIPERHGVRALTHDTLYRWITAHRDGGRWALVDGYGNRAGQCLISVDQDLYTATLGRMLSDPQATGRDLFAWLRTRFDADRLPSLRSVQRFRETWLRDNAQTWLFLTAPGKWKNKHQAAFGSQIESVVRLNQLWEMDSTPGDWLLTDGRHSVVGCIDLYSRRLKLRVSKSSSAYAVGQTFRAAVLDWGLPEAVRTDNGKDYVSDYFAGVLSDLDVAQYLCIPFASEQKGTVERVLKTVCYGLAKLLPGYIGHNVAEAQDIRSRETFAKRILTPGELVDVSMSAADLQEALDGWVEQVYHQDPHSGEGMDGLSPIAKAAAWSGEILTVDARALDALLAPLAGERVVGKKGIRWDHARYVSPILGEYIGETVRCRYDEADLGRLYVYTDDKFLCVAQDPARTGISRAEVAAVARAQQRQLNARHTKEAAALKRKIKVNAAEEVIRHRAKQAGKLIGFPHREAVHSTPMLTAGADAADAAQPKTPQHDTPEQAAARARLAEDIAQAQANVQRLPEGPKDRYRRWMRIDRDMRNGFGCERREDLDWWERYPLTPEHKAQTRLAEAFPDAYRLGTGAVED